MKEKLESIERAWVIFWEDEKEENIKNSKLITIINDDKRPEEIADFISQYWVAVYKSDSISGKIGSAKMDKNAFIMHTQVNIVDNTHVVCGYNHNYIEASICSDIKYYDNDDFEYTNRFGNKYKNFEIQDSYALKKE